MLMSPPLRAKLGQTAPVFLFRVKDAKNDDAFSDHLVECLRKPCDQDAAETSKVARAQFRTVRQGAQRKCHRIEKLVAEPGVLALIPLAHCGQILLGLRSQVEQPLHRRRRSRASTSDQGAPAEGFAS